MNDYQKIIDEIKNGLTDDQIKNKKYLLEQSEKYKTHPLSHEILKEIGRMLYDNLSDEEKKSMNSAVNEDLGNLNSKITEANKCIMQRDFDKAKSLLNEFLGDALITYKEDQITRYFSFKDIIEFYCSKGVIKTDKKIVWVNLRYDVAYKLLGYIASEENEFDKAREYLDKGLHYNPMSTEIRFEKAESYKMQKDLEKMFETTKEIYDYILDPQDLSRYYRLLGYYYIEKNKLDVAYALYALSIYYKNSEMAHHEIAYIKQQLGEPDYKISTKDIVDILEKEHIEKTISQENISKLKQLSLEKELQEKQPELMKYLNVIIAKFANPINIDKPIEGLETSMPKITSEDVIDENKVIFDDSDKIRIKKNLEFLKQNNIPFLEDMKAIPLNSSTSLKDKKEILDRALVDYVVASMTVYALEGKTASILNVLDEMDAKLHVKTILSDRDIKFIHAISENKVSKQELQDVSWVFEECAVLLWALGLLNKPNSNKECNVNDLNEIMFNNSYDELLSKCNLKSKEEILEFADLIFRYYWYCREAKIKKEEPTNLNEMIVQEQRMGLEWMLNWSLDKIMKESINVKYEKDDFSFEYAMPTEVKFAEVNNIKDPYQLFVLTNKDRSVVINFIDCGKGTPESLESIVKQEVNYLKDTGSHIIGEYDLSASNLKGKVKQVLTTKVIPNLNNKLVGMSKYYFALNNHITCLECVLLDENINYQDINSIQNSKSNSIMTGILFSIHDVGTTNINNDAIEIAKIMNYELHAKQLDIPILNGFKIENNNNEPKNIITASDGMYTEMVYTDGTLNQNETFEQRINLVNKNLIDFLKQQSPLNDEKCMFYYKDYTNGIFNYKIYVEEMFFEVDGVKKVIRQLVAYFLEPRFNDFYQLTISAPPLQMPTEVLKVGIVDLKNDQITKNMDMMLKVLMDNLKYKDDDQKKNTNYQESMNMNDIEVPYNKGEGDVIMADSKELYKAAIESSVIQNLVIDSNDINTADNVKNLYRIILVCGEFENPILDENNLSEFLLDKNKVINLIKKFKEINQTQFNNELSYLTFDIDDDLLVNKLIDILKESFKKKQTNENSNDIEEVNMDFYEEEKEAVINNEFDYSNIIPTAENIGNIVQYCENVYNQLLKLIEEDEQKNERLKFEYKNYMYAKSYGEKFEVSIREKTYNNLNCKTYNSYIEAVNNGQLREVNSLEIRMDLDYRRGSGSNLKQHENSFTIIFKPYEIKFARKSNFNETNMNQIENTINNMLQQFQKANSIFCTK